MSEQKPFTCSNDGRDGSMVNYGKIEEARFGSARFDATNLSDCAKFNPKNYCLKARSVLP